MSKTILIGGNAGQGKTTFAVNLASALRSFGYRVLLVDADLKTPKLAYHVGAPLANCSIQDVLLKKLPLDSCLYETPSGVKLLLSSFSDVETHHPSTLLPELEKLADVVVIDTSSYDLNWQGHKFVLVSQPDLPSIANLRKNYGPQDSVIINRARHDSFELSAGNVSEFLNMPVSGVIPEEAQMREALRQGISLVDLHPESQTCTILKQIAAKLMNVEYKSPLRKVPLLTKLGIMP